MNEATQKSKVICIGWHKTGTSTIGMALIRLGYSVVGARLDTTDALFKGDMESVYNIASKFDALQDVPWAALYRELDQQFPGSKFILTTRQDENWLNSAKKHFGNSDIPLHKWLYSEGVLEGNEEMYIERYRRHNREVKEYFKHRSYDLLIMNFEEGDGWEKLCPFLGHDIPASPFPHANKGKHNYNRQDKIIHKLRSWTPGIFRKALFHSKLFLLKPFGYRDPRNKFNNFSQNRNECRKWAKLRNQKS